MSLQNEERVFVPDTIDDAPNEVKERPPRQTRRPSTRGATKLSVTDLRGAFELASAALALSGNPQYALTTAECDELAKVWTAVLNEYPSIQSQLFVGKLATVWGRAIFTTVIIIYGKVRTVPIKDISGTTNGNVTEPGNETKNSDTSGATRVPGGNDWFRENDIGAVSVNGTP